MTTSPQAPAATNAAKRLARLAAVQALYQSSYEQEPLKDIIQESLASEFAGLRDESDGAEAITDLPDPVLFREVAEGVLAHLEDIDGLLAGALDPRMSVARLEILLRTILRAGAFELHHHAQIPAGVIINDYVDVTRAFFNTKEPGLVNAVLDKLAKNLRG